MKKLLIVALLGFFSTGHAQKLHLNLFAGVANYKGDLQYNARSGKQFSLKQPNFAGGIGLEYELTEKLSARLGVTLAKINADDKVQLGQFERNLNFTSSVFDGMLALQYYILNPNKHLVSPYVFAGLAYFHFNPYTFDTSGNKVFLQPLSTEGQGFVEGREPYKLSQFSIPLGGGLKFSLSENFRVGVEVSLRKTFTDYLDDVSSTYIDETILLANRGPQAVDLAFRGDELKTGLVYPIDGTQRGTQVRKDWYYFTGLTVSYRLGNGSGGSGSGKKNKLGCPVLR
jgi:opacity protein-like surface antigen